MFSFKTLGILCSFRRERKKLYSGQGRIDISLFSKNSLGNVALAENVNKAGFDGKMMSCHF